MMTEAKQKNQKKVFVSGCFDLLHSGHIAFFEEAASYGDLYVALGSDRTVFDLKGRKTVNSEEERLYMVKSLSMVKEAFISQGSGMLDFIGELNRVRPDIFIVNSDGNTPDKRALCEELKIEYKVLHREPKAGLPARSTTDLRTVLSLPYRIDVAGGWLDQPFVSKKYPGPVITISLEPTIEFNERSGMATSTRRAAAELWGPKIPVGDYEKTAKMLFCYDNPPGTKEISGSQDAIGLVYPGLAIAHYDGEYWPYQIESVQDEETLRFIENALYLIPLGPRESGFSVLENTHITKKNAKALSDAAYVCWDAILAHNIQGFGKYVRAGFEGQIAMFPNMIIPAILELIETYRSQALGWKISGAGGGGYLILVAENEIEDALRVRIRRANE
jgi:cytidyltransferase-like protein